MALLVPFVFLRKQSRLCLTYIMCSAFRACLLHNVCVHVKVAIKFGVHSARMHSQQQQHDAIVYVEWRDIPNNLQ